MRGKVDRAPHVDSTCWPDISPVVMGSMRVKCCSASRWYHGKAEKKFQISQNGRFSDLGTIVLGTIVWFNGPGSVLLERGPIGGKLPWRSSLLELPEIGAFHVGEKIGPGYW